MCKFAVKSRLLAIGVGVPRQPDKAVRAIRDRGTQLARLPRAHKQRRRQTSRPRHSSAHAQQPSPHLPHRLEPRDHLLPDPQEEGLKGDAMTLPLVDRLVAALRRRLLGISAEEIVEWVHEGRRF